MNIGGTGTKLICPVCNEMTIFTDNPRQDIYVCASCSAAFKDIHKATAMAKKIQETRKQEMYFAARQAIAGRSQPYGETK